MGDVKGAGLSCWTLNPSTETLIAEATFCSSGWEGLSTSGIAELSTTNGIFPEFRKYAQSCSEYGGWQCKGPQSSLFFLGFKIEGRQCCLHTVYISSINARVLDLELFIYKIGVNWRASTFSSENLLPFLTTPPIKQIGISEKSIKHHLELYQKTPW